MISPSDAWCALGSPPVDAVLSGGFLATLGIVVAPFVARIPIHQPGTEAYSTVKKKRLRKWSRRLAVPALLASIVAVASYVFVYADVGGRSCHGLDVTSTPINGAAVALCIAAIVITLALVTIISVLRIKFDAANQ